MTKAEWLDRYVGPADTPSRLTLRAVADEAFMAGQAAGMEWSAKHHDCYALGHRPEVGKFCAQCSPYPPCECPRCHVNKTRETP